MKKKGQVAYFIIAGLLITILIVAIVWVAQRTKKEQADVEALDSFRSDETELIDYVTSCIAQTAHQGLLEIAASGGFTSLDPIPDVAKFEGQFSDVAYWYYDHGNIQPTLDEVDRRLEYYADNKLRDCTGGFDPFKLRGMEIIAEEPKSSVTFTKEGVDVSVRYPISARRGTDVTRLEEFNAKLNIRFRQLYETATAINHFQMEEDFQVNDPLFGIQTVLAPQFEWIDGITADYESASILGSNIDTIEYTVTDKKAKELGEGFFLRFASRFEDSELVRTLALERAVCDIQSDGLMTPAVLQSQDRRFELLLEPGTRILDSDGNEFNDCEISVQQEYPLTVIRENVPVSVYTDLNDRPSEPTRVQMVEENWPLSTPLYRLEPDGLVFVDGWPKMIRLCQDPSEEFFDASDDDPNVAGSYLNNPFIIYEHDGTFRPLPLEYDDNCVYTYIPGFSAVAAGSCHGKDAHDFSTKVKAGGDSSCWLKLAIIVAISIIVTAAAIQAFGASALVSSSSSGVMSTLGAAFSPAFWSGLTGWRIAAMAGGVLVGGYFLTPEQQYEAQPSTVPFTPTCDQLIIIEKKTKKAKGECLLNGEPVEGEMIVKAGTAYQLQAVLKKCSGKFCPKCEVTCTASQVR